MKSQMHQTPSTDESFKSNDFTRLAGQLSTKFKQLHTVKSAGSLSGIAKTFKEPPIPKLQEIIEINKRMNILYQRKSYILKFYEKPEANRFVIHNNNYIQQDFNEKYISQSERGWHYYEGQAIDGQFHGFGTLHFNEQRVSGMFERGVAHGRISLFEKNVLSLIAIYSEGAQENVITRR